MVKKILVRSFLLIVLSMMYLPIIWLIVFSFTESPTFTDWTGFSFQPFIDLFTGSKSGEIFSALGNTMIIALAAAAISTLLGTLAAIGLNSMRSKRLRNSYNNISNIPMINADIITAVSLMLLFTFFRSLFGLYGDASIIDVILAHTSFCVPYVILNVMPRLKGMDNSVYEAALDLGATPMQALRKVVVPEIMPGIVMGFIMAMTLSIDDFVVSFFTIDGFDTLSTYIYTVNSGKTPLPPHLRALSSLMFLLILGLLLFVNIKNSKATKKLRAKGVKK